MKGQNPLPLPCNTLNFVSMLSQLEPNAAVCIRLSIQLGGCGDLAADQMQRISTAAIPIRGCPHIVVSALVTISQTGVKATAQASVDAPFQEAY